MRRRERKIGSLIPIGSATLFWDRTSAFGLEFGKAENLIESGKVEPIDQLFQAPGGPTTRKAIYKFYHHYAYRVGTTQEEPTLIADFVEDENGHILPYVRFQGGSLTIAGEALRVLDEASSHRLGDES